MHSQILNQPSVPHQSKHKIKIIIIALLSLAVIGCIGFILLVNYSYTEYQNSPKLVEGVHTQSSAAVSYQLSADQAKVVSQSGYPDSFSITFYKEEFAPDYTGEVRDELWRYYKEGTAYTFYNGALTYQEPIVNGPTSWVPLPYHPDQFVAYTNLRSIVASASIKDYFELPLEKELIENGKLYYAPGLTFGTVNDRLIYVETISMQAQGE
jgi:hypothetical protein